MTLLPRILLPALAGVTLSLGCSLGSTGPADTQAPLVRIDSPRDGVSVRGSVTISATTQDDVGVVQVRFLVIIGGSTTVVCTLNAAPTTCLWNSTSTPDGTAVAIRVEASDAAGNLGAASVGVTVQNGPQ
jgi:hypothetical protein